MIEERICANLQLQKEDSLMNLELDTAIKFFFGLQDSMSIFKLMGSQEKWERYRFSHCKQKPDDGGETLRAIIFMRCATEQTSLRRKYIRSLPK